MTDLEMTKLCAEARGIRLEWDGDPREFQPLFYEGKTYHMYNPLNNDAQAMALLKKFPIHIDRLTDELVSVWIGGGEHVATGKDLNRAIVECVAKMQASK